MRTPITAAELTEILRLHQLWLVDDESGVRADLRSADLSFADLRSADLRSADLRSADLSFANLRSANLSFANLSFADLSSANLSFANLSSANLRSADLRSADLSFANLLHGGQDIRGYLFYGFQNDSGVMEIRAGCREFVGIYAARQHWQNRHVDDPILYEDCLSLVDRLERLAKARGWQLEPQIETEKENEKAN